MSDSSKADAFGQIFAFLEQRLSGVDGDEGPEFDINIKEIARGIYDISQAYDFHPCEMECGEEMISLGLARWDPSLKGEDSEVWFLYSDYER